MPATRSSAWNLVWPILLFTGLASGQLLRLTLVPGTSGALAGLDFALLGVSAVFAIRLIAAGAVRRFARSIWRHPVWKWTAWFAGWATVSLLVNAPAYTFGQLALAGAYLGRLLLALFLAWAISFESGVSRRVVIKTFLIAAAALIAAGFLQWVFVPDFNFMQKYGWDPHIGRLLSTFFDPNYFGIFSVLVMAVSLGLYFQAKPKPPSRFYPLAVFLAGWAALYLTFSRSAWFAGMIAIAAMAFKRSWKLSVLFLVIFIGSLLLPTRLGQRFRASQNLIQRDTFQKGYQCTIEQQRAKLCDPSSSARVFSLRRGWALATISPLTGVGYNAYSAALTHYHLAPQESSHASQGSDSSLLNLLATTGLAGLLLFLGFLVVASKGLRRLASAGGAYHWAAHGLFWFTIAWVAAAFFNNSLLYPSILVPWLVLVATRLPRRLG
jgi:O-antigen ligase/polysaccharide polymerase Wzy-like membrane protein